MHTTTGGQSPAAHVPAAASGPADQSVPQSAPGEGAATTPLPALAPRLPELAGACRSLPQLPGACRSLPERTCDPTPGLEIETDRFVTPALVIRVAGSDFPLPLRRPFTDVAGTTVRIRYRHADLSCITVLLDGAWHLISAAAAWAVGDVVGETRALAGLLAERRTPDALPGVTYSLGTWRLHELDEMGFMCGRCGAEVDDEDVDVGMECPAGDFPIDVGDGIAVSIEWGCDAEHDHRRGRGALRCLLGPGHARLRAALALARGKRAPEPTSNPGARARDVGMLAHAEVRGGEWHDAAGAAEFVQTYTMTHGDSGSLRGSLAGPDVLIPLPRS